MKGWSRGQKKTCRKKQHVTIYKERYAPKTIRCLAAVGRNYNSTRNKKEQQEKDRAYYGEHYSRYISKFPVRFGEIPSTEKYNPVSDEAGENEIMFVMVRDCHTIGNGSCGSYITARTMQHTSRVIHHDLGFKEFDYHSLRHTHATMLRANGAPEIYISKRLGHKRVEITMELYANHLTDIDITAGHKVLQGML